MEKIGLLKDEEENIVMHLMFFYYDYPNQNQWQILKGSKFSSILSRYYSVIIEIDFLNIVALFYMFISIVH